MALRWGIASAGRISHDFVCALQTLPKADHEIVAIGARSLESAESFAKSHNIPKAICGYEALAKLPEIEIVYIGAINTNHFELSKLMLENGKHVLCEKPLTMNRKQTSALLEIARNSKLFFMEAVWSRCFPIYKELRKQIDSGIIGDVMNIHVTLGFYLEHISRLNSRELGGGTILDLGVYPLQISQFVFKGLKPTKMIGCGFLNSSGVDQSADCILQYPGNKSSSISTSAMVQLSNEAIITGTKGTIRMPLFWCPSTLITPKETFEMKLPESKETFNFYNSTGLSYEAEECRKCIRNGLLESPEMPHSDSLELSGLMDSWRKLVGVIYEQDLE